MINTRRHSARRERGAALIVAVGVLTLLLVIALTFFRASLGDMKTAENTVNGVRAELLADGATAVAMAFLNHDRTIHPSFTSLDHAWRTYFNGSWAVGKPYLWAPLQDSVVENGVLVNNGVHRLSLLRGGVPEVNPGINPALFAANDTMYIPRRDYAVAGPNIVPGDLPQDFSTANGNFFVTTGDLAAPGVPSKFPPFEVMFGDPLLDNVADFVADFVSLETTVYDDIGGAAGRVLSLRDPIVNPTGNADATNQTLPYEQIHFWTDVDNDGDGLRDSMWLPIGADRFYPGDGLDNDLDGHFDGDDEDGIDNNGNGEVDEANEGDDTDGEPGVFLYRGDTDGIDNDGNGQVDEDAEYSFVLFTVPLPFLLPTGTGAPVSPAEFAAMGIQPTDTVKFEGTRGASNQYNDPIGFGRTNNPIYTRDNDYDLVLDQPSDASRYMLNANYDVNPANGRADAIDALINGDANYPYYNLLVDIVGANTIADYIAAGAVGPLPIAGAIRGETVTTLAGRMAILIKDEASKVNINAAGGWDYPVFPNPLSLPAEGPLLALESADSNILSSPFQRAFADGVGPFEYDTRVLPKMSFNGGIGAQRSRWMWQYLMGARQGFFAQAYLANDPFDLGYYTPELEGDATLPGYGYVDDDANLLQLALDGINNHGGPNYLTDPNIPLDPRVDQGLLSGKWEGIDEPGEYQRFRPLRNLVAEGVAAPNTADDDGDDLVNEIGEMGDQYFRTHQQLKLINAGTFGGGIGVRGLNSERVFDELRNFITAHSTDRNERHNYPELAPLDFQLSVNRQTTGLKKDLNVSRPEDVARAVTRGWSYPASGPERWVISGGALVPPTLASPPLTYADLETTNFLAGLRQENVTVATAESIMGLPTGVDDNSPPRPLAFTMLADAELRAHQVAASIKDFADRDFTRSEDDEIFAEDFWWRSLAEQAVTDNPGNQAIADAELIARTQRISYTTAGLEAIRINEIMVRPVRRFEAEAMTNLDASDANIAIDRGLDPNRFVPHVLGYPPADQTAAEAIEEQGFRMRVTTTEDAIAAYNTNRNPNPLSPGPPLTITADDQAAMWSLFPATPDRLGLESAWSTFRRELDVNDPDAQRTFRVPDVLQLSFQATGGLPAGRYYVTVNTQWVDDNGVTTDSVTNESDFNFAVKIGTREQDWFADAVNIDTYRNGGEIVVPWRAPAILGDDTALGGSRGMAFLQGDNVYRTNANAAPLNPFTNTLLGFQTNNDLQRNLGFTIEVPERDLANPPIDDDLWLHIALRSMRPDGVRFVVNYIEFSQEPDHEWVELSNSSNEAIDLSGWQLAVQNHPLSLGPMTIPAGTLIAPKGMLLLGTNKFDYAYNAILDPVTGEPISPVIPGDASLIRDPDLFDRGVGFFSNGIGLVNSTLANLVNTPALPNMVPFETITVPQIRYDGVTSTVQGSVFEGYILDRTAPIIAPADFVDYVERDGDGAYDITQPEDAQTESTLTGASYSAPLLLDMFPFDLNVVEEQKPWDRIVELIVPDLVPQPPATDFSAADVGRLVLGGGIFPNRPEFDGVDNDGDNAVLSFDNIDNDGDGDIDELDEGFDEGRAAREARLVDGVTAVPGSYHPEIAPYITNFFDFDPATGLVPAYWDGGALAPNPPQWKEFLERRNFPGENVIVTLFEGPASNNQIADRVTYTQRDVENRQIDDTLFVNDFDTAPVPPFGDAGVLVGDPGVPVPLDDRFPSFWPENTMGIDFARSLERKHPDYTGDRFGTQNRFQATDGNYDDWSDSAGRWERRLTGDQPTDMDDRLDLLIYPNYAEFAHALSGTPLRANVATRFAQRDAPRRDVFDRAEFPNRPLVSPGSALLMAHTSRTGQFSTFIDPVTTENFLTDPASPNISDGARSDLTYDSALIGQRFDDAAAPINFFRDARAFLGDTGTTDSVSLNVGQATVLQVVRGGAGADVSPGEQWPLSFGVLTGLPPQRWNPLMMFALPDDSAPTSPQPDIGFDRYGYRLQYLFQPLGSPPFPATVENDRWPRELRTALYASRNFDNFNSTNPAADPFDGAQALFVWDGDDGLENGEYDVYIVATEDLSLLARANVSNGGNLLTDTGLPAAAEGVGLPFLNATTRTANREVYFDIEVFRDSNGDRTAWVDPDNDGFILNADLQRGVAGVPFESFGTVTGAQPGADGVIHYGVVRVENNFLAVSLRNRSAPGVVARVSRVILAARNKTPGRININTVESRRISVRNVNDPNDLSDSDARHFYNPLTGLPGVLKRPTDDDDVGSTPPSDATTGIPTDFGDELAIVLAGNIVNQRLRLTGEQPDGRYYELTTDLLMDAHFASIDDNPATIAGAPDPAFRPPLVIEYDNYLDAADPATARSGAIGEAAYRFKRMQNLITTKGEVFEILVTVQAGYGTDTNGDGRINWRDDKEFTATAEKTARTIYER